MTIRVTMIQTRIGTAGATLTAGQSYNVTDDLANSLVGSGFASYTYAETAWERRPNGAYDGEVRRFTGVGNVPFVEARWNATATQWEPNGRQLMYSADYSTTASGLTPTVALATVVCNAGLLGTNLALDFDLECHGSANGPTARSITLTFGATAVVGEVTALARRFGRQVLLRNAGATNAQTITTKADGEYTSYQSANSAGGAGTEDTTAAINITGSAAYTYAANQTVSLDRYQIWWTK